MIMSCELSLFEDNENTLYFSMEMKCIIWFTYGVKINKIKLYMVILSYIQSKKRQRINLKGHYYWYY